MTSILVVIAVLWLIDKIGLVSFLMEDYEMNVMIKEHKKQIKAFKNRRI